MVRPGFPASEGRDPLAQISRYPAVQLFVQRAAAARHGKASGLLVRDGATAAARQAEGWTFVAIGSDTTLLAAAVAAELGRARPSTPDTRGGH